MAMLWDNVQRIVWISDEVKKQQEPIVRELSSRANALQYFSVSRGLRKALITSSADESSVTNMAREYGLKWKILGKYKNYSGFSHRLTVAGPGDATITYFAVGKDGADLDVMEKGFNEFDNTTQGELLGYPICCVEAFKTRWHQLNHNDHVLDAAVAMHGKISSNMYLENIGHTNQFFRYCGPHLIFHLPCSFACQNSIELAQKHEELELELFGDKKLYEFLSQPFTASIYRGIVEVTSTTFRIISATDFTKEKFTITVR